jgi:hypothetical protein
VSPESAEARTCPHCRGQWTWPWAGEGKNLLCHDFNIEAFDIYSIWLYEGKIPVSEPESNGIRFWPLLRAYVLGIRIKDTKFGQALVSAMKEMAATFRKILAQNQINYMYQNVEGYCELKQWLVQEYVRSPHSPTNIKTAEDKGTPFCPEFLRDLAPALLEEQRSTNRAEGRGNSSKD